MPLTEKEKRAITSPHSFLSSKQRKTTKFRTKKKIQETLQDIKFLIENHSEISEMFGIDVINYNNENNDIAENIQLQETIPTNNNAPKKDPDLL